MKIEWKVDQIAVKSEGNKRAGSWWIYFSLKWMWESFCMLQVYGVEETRSVVVVVIYFETMKEPNFWLLLLMIFSDGETWWDAFVVECKEGMYNKNNKRDTLLLGRMHWW
jgi:hypothetical protein